MVVVISGVVNASCVIAEEINNLVFAEGESASNFDNYTGRYIIKYKASNGKDITEEAVEKAFRKSKIKKEDKRLSGDSIADTKKIENKLKYQNVSNKSKISYTEARENDIIKINEDNYKVIQLEEQVSPDIFCEEVENYLGNAIDYIQPDYTVTLSADETDENSFEINTQIIDMNLGESLDEAVVAVLDTGVDVSHEALQAVVVPGYDFCNNNTDIEINNKSTE